MDGLARRRVLQNRARAKQVRRFRNRPDPLLLYICSNKRREFLERRVRQSLNQPDRMGMREVLSLMRAGRQRPALEESESRAKLERRL